MYVNPAASSAGQDYTIGNVILLPLMTIIDGPASAARGCSAYSTTSGLLEGLWSRGGMPAEP